ncbi:MAG: PfkB family carbohydrate kinase, partial [Candidatus Cloacimonadota bacterium]|nr:PfkB family carbohydrate kinase [Candidatus Cloacimonadota bacterium]
IHIVDKRDSSKSYSRMKNIEDFATKVRAAAGMSANFELITKQTKLGGNGPIFANALIQQNHQITYFGSIGEKVIHPLFTEFAQGCEKVFSWCKPGYTQALEFLDGKIMIGKAEHLEDVNWEKMLQSTNEKELLEIIDSSKLIAITNWTGLINLNSIFRGITNLLKKSKHNPFVFIDLADPTKRTSKDIKELLEIISNLNKFSSVIFGLNKNESRLIAENLNIFEENLKLRASEIQKKMNIDFVVIHPLEGAVCATVDKTIWVDGPYTKNPKMTTGAGDNFNSGFCNGCLNKLNVEESLAVGVMTSGYYVRNCKSPSREELIDFIDEWVK